MFIFLFFYLIVLTFIILSSYFIPPRAKILGINVGLQSSASAYEELNLYVKNELDKSLEINTPQGKFLIDPKNINLEIELAQTISKINRNPINFLLSLAFTSEVSPTVTLDEFKLRKDLQKVIEQNTFQAKDATLTTKEGKIITTSAKSGQEIDWKKTIKEIKESWLHKNREAFIQIKYIVPKINDEDVLKQRTNLAEIALSSPIKIKLGNEILEISPKIIGTALSFVEENNQLVSKFNENVIKQEISRQLPNIQEFATDARFEFTNNNVTLIPSQNGLKFIPGQLDAAFSPIFKQKENRIVNLENAVVKPKITTESLRSLGITEQLSSFTQDFEFMPYREKNVAQAAKYMDGKLLKPGEIYSMNETIKERTAANGYVKGIYIGEGGRFAMGMGGGVSIITSATWSAAFYAGMERIEQRAHSVLISRYQPGLEATVSWPKLDLKFKNNTNNYVMIKTIPKKDSITVSFYGTKIYDKVTAIFGKPYSIDNKIDTVISYDKNCLAQDPAPGFKINVIRQFWKNKSVIKTENLLTRYRPSDHIICLKEGEVAPTVSPTPNLTGVEQPTIQSDEGTIS